MSEKDHRRTLERYLILLVVFILPAFVSARLMASYDLWTNLAFGRRLLAEGSIFSIQEPFILGLQNIEAIGIDGPFQILLYMVHSIGGSELISLSIAITAGFVWFTVFWGASQRGGSVEGRALLAAFVVAASYYAIARFLPRPETLAYLFGALSCASLLRWLARPTLGVFLLLVGLLFSWKLTHVTGSIGFTLISLTILFNPQIEYWRKLLKRKSDRYLLVAATPVVAWLFWQSGSFALEVFVGLQQGGRMAAVSEMLPVWKFPMVAIHYISLALVGVIATLLSKDRVRLGVPVLCSFLVGLIVYRNTVLALIFILSLSGVTIVSLSFNFSWFRPLCLGVLAIVVSSVACFSIASQDPPMGLGSMEELFPLDTASFVKENQLPGNIYNEMEYGGVLNWVWDGSPPTFADGRVLGGDLFQSETYQMREATNMAPLLSKHKINTAIVRSIYKNNGRISGSVYWFISHPDWKLVRATDALLFVRSNMTRLPALPRKDAWSFVYRELCETENLVYNKSHLSYSKGVALFHLGDRERARREIEAGLTQFPEHREYYQRYVLLTGFGR